MSVRISHSRVQHGVGQGSFHSASVEVYEGGRSHRFDYVYDCGALSGGAPTQELKRAIKRMDVDRRQDFGEKGVIDLLVLSHYDQDHINGAKDLVDKCKVKRIVVPYVGPEELALVLLSQAAEISVDMVFTLHQLANGASKFFGVPVTMVRSSGADNNNEGDTSQIPGDGGKSDQILEERFPRSIEPAVGKARLPLNREMSDADNVGLTVDGVSKSPFWKLRFWNRGVDSKLLNNVSTELKNCGFPLDALKDQAKVNEVVDWLIDSDNKKKALIAYRRAIDIFAPTWKSESTGYKLANFLSLAMYSGPCDLSKKSWDLEHASWLPAGEAYLPFVRPLWGRPGHWRDRTIDLAGWLGTGDAPLGESKTWGDFAQHYHLELTSTGTVLVPHHGAAPKGGLRFYNPGLHPRPGMLAVISAGKNNSYGHPRAAVIKQLMFQNVQIELVTEDATLGLHEVFLIKA